MVNTAMGGTVGQNTAVIGAAVTLLRSWRGSGGGMRLRMWLWMWLRMWLLRRSLLMLLLLGWSALLSLLMFVLGIGGNNHPK
jgi:hypothetical protein